MIADARLEIALRALTEGWAAKAAARMSSRAHPIRPASWHGFWREVEAGVGLHLGAVPLHQLRSAMHELERRTERAGGPLLALLELLAGRFLVWSRGALRLSRCEALSWQRGVAYRVYCDQVRAVALALHCLPNEADARAALRPRDLGRRQLQRELEAPLLLLTDDVWCAALAEEGLAEVHRHHALSLLPERQWQRILELAPLGALAADARQVARDPALADLPRVVRLLRRLRATLVAWLRDPGQEHSAGYAPHGGSSRLDESPDDTLEGVLDVALSTLQDWAAGRRERAEVDWGCPLGLGASPGRVPLEAALRGPGDHPALDPDHVSALGERAFLMTLCRQLATRRPRHDWQVLAFSYAVLQNAVFGCLVQAPRGEGGLERFVEMYGDAAVHRFEPALGPVEDRAEVLRQALRVGGVSWLELRISPAGALRRKLLDIGLAARSCRTGRGESPLAWARLQRPADDTIREVVEAARQGAPGRCPRLGVVLHFIRRADDRWSRPSPLESDEPEVSAAPAREPRTGLAEWLPRVRHQTLRQQVREQAGSIRRIAADSRLAPLLVGLDIAGKETEAPVEVFAPAIRSLRAPFYSLRERRETVLPSGIWDAAPVFGLTCHAGEDFRHLLSGIRQVLEALTFLDLDAGDRLGHGLALGLDWDRWRARLGERAILPRLDWLDSVVVLHQYAARWPWAAAQVQELQRDIALHSARVYGEAREQGVLWRAWSLRGEDPLEPALTPWPTAHRVPDADEQSLERIRRRIDGLGRPAAAAAYRRREERRLSAGEEAWTLWYRYHSDLGVRERGDELVEVPLPDDWLRMVTAFQDALLEEVVRRQIAIEVNPSSNLCIGPIDSLEEHPIFRWSPPGAPKQALRPAVIIGTDDPAVFNTELAQEYGLLAQAAESQGVHPQDIADWLHRLRDTSVRYSFVRRSSDPPPVTPSTAESWCPSSEPVPSCDSALPRAGSPGHSDNRQRTG